MKLTVIGSADASNSAGRGHSFYWLDGALTEGGLMARPKATVEEFMKLFFRRVC